MSANGHPVDMEPQLLEAVCPEVENVLPCPQTRNMSIDAPFVEGSSTFSPAATNSPLRRNSLRRSISMSASKPSPLQRGGRRGTLATEALKLRRKSVRECPKLQPKSLNDVELAVMRLYDGKTTLSRIMAPPPWEKSTVPQLQSKSKVKRLQYSFDQIMNAMKGITAQRSSNTVRAVLALRASAEHSVSQAISRLVSSTRCTGEHFTASAASVSRDGHGVGSSSREHDPPSASQTDYRSGLDCAPLRLIDHLKRHRPPSSMVGLKVPTVSHKPRLTDSDYDGEMLCEYFGVPTSARFRMYF